MRRIELSAERASHFAGCAHVAITGTSASKPTTTEPTAVRTMTTAAGQTSWLRRERQGVLRGFSGWSSTGGHPPCLGEAWENLGACTRLNGGYTATRWAASRYAKTSFHSFVSGVPVCAAFAVFRHLWHLADAWLALAGFATTIHHSHRSPVEERKRVEQFCPPSFCDCHGSELYRHDHSWNCDGCEVWSESQGSILLLGVGSIVAFGFCFASAFQMTMPAQSAPRDGSPPGSHATVAAGWRRASCSQRRRKTHNPAC